MVAIPVPSKSSNIFLGRTAIVVVFLFVGSMPLWGQTIGGLSIGKGLAYDGWVDSVLTAEGYHSGYFTQILIRPNFYDLSVSKSVDRAPSPGFALPPLDESRRYDEVGTWSVTKSGPLFYLNLKSKTDYTYKSKLGMLIHPNWLYLYDGNKIFFASDAPWRWSGELPTVIGVRSSSHLTEGKIEYTGSKFKTPYVTNPEPWVEGAKGQGIGEWVEITTKTLKFPVNYLLISNGYVDFDKPYLYYENSRIKRVRILVPKHNLDFEVVLKDTPNFQEVQFPENIFDGNVTIRFVIEDVYPGTKWSDTCLNLIVPMAYRP